MRHGKKFNHLGRTTSHRNAMLSNMAASLILHKRINTTLPKAKALRKFVEPLLTKSKENTTHSRRIVFSYLKDKKTVHELFANVSEKIAERPGGYTRIIKLGNRLGDSAEMCMMELVDFNDVFQKEQKTKKSRRSRRGSKKTKEDTPAPSNQETTPQVTAETPPTPKASESDTQESKSEENTENKSEKPKSDNPDA